MRVDGGSGWLKSFAAGGKELLKAPLRPNFWRVPTDNDNGWKVPKLMGAWKDAAARAVLQSLGLETNRDNTTLTARLTLPIGNTTAQINYGLRADGRLHVEFALEPDPNAPELPRMGMTLAIPAGLTNVAWYGRGPQENYWDRKTGAAVGIYHSTVDEWITHYVRPQENANRTDVRWIDFTTGIGEGLRLEADGPPLGVSAWPYSANDLAAATHDHLLPSRDFITVNLDGWQMGIGGDNSWGLPVHEKYRFTRSVKCEFGFDLYPHAR